MSPLLALPAEIHNQIYGYVLCNEDISICSNDEYFLTLRHDRGFDNWIRFFGHAHFPRQILYILEVCQQIHAEAKLLVFRLNTLNGSLPNLDIFLFCRSALSSHQSSALRSVGVKLGYDDVYDIHSCVRSEFSETCRWQLEELAKLQDLEGIIIRVGVYYTDGQRNLKDVPLAKAIEEAVYQEDKMVKVQVVAEFLSE